MRKVLLGALLMGWINCQGVPDTEPKCQEWEVIHESRTSWSFRMLYSTSFGVLHNMTALQTLDIRKDNFFLMVQPWQLINNSGLKRDIFYRLLEIVFGAYLKDVVDGPPSTWNEDEMKWELAQMKPNRTGSVEEMFRFQAKYFMENVIPMTEDQIVYFQSFANSSLNDLANIKKYTVTPSNMEIETSMDGMLESMFLPTRAFGFFDWWERSVRYQKWFEEKEDKVMQYLTNITFFQKIEDNELSNMGSHDLNILELFLISPKVLKSSKVRTLLRMTVAKANSDTKQIDKHFFNLLDCFVAEYGESSLINMLGFSNQNLQQNIQNLKISYKEEVSKYDKLSNNYYWIDLADAVLDEVEALDIHELFYHMYIYALEIRSFILSLDIENKIFPQYQQIQILAQEAFFRLLENPKPLGEILQIVQTETFWIEAKHVFEKFMQSFSLPTISMPSFNILDDFPAAGDVFKMELSDDGQLVFAATQFFRKYRKSNQKPLFLPQLKLEMVDPRNMVNKAARLLRRWGIGKYADLESALFNLLKNTTTFDNDWSTLETVKLKIGDNLEDILGELEK